MTSREMGWAEFREIANIIARPPAESDDEPVANDWQQ